MFNFNGISQDDAKLIGMALAHMQERIGSVLANMQAQVNQQQAEAAQPKTGEPIRVDETPAA